jgi:glycosyltransferase involved in cell wall biosynthesis
MRQFRRKILLVDNELTISGASLMLFSLAEHLISQGFTLDIAAVSSKDGALRARYEAIGAVLPEQLNAEDYALCIANTIFSVQLVAAISPHVKTIWWIHEADNGLQVALGNPQLYSNAFLLAHKIVFPVARLRDDIYRSFLYPLPAAKVAIVANGIQLDEQITPVKHSGLFRIVSVATIDMRKRQGDILEAVEKLDDPDIEVILVGQKNQLSAAGEKVLQLDRERESKRYHLLGALEHEAAMRWLASADILVHPASVETQPLAPLEAAILGIPMVLTSLDVYLGIWHHGENCLMHGVGDIELLAEMIHALKRNRVLASRLAAQAQIMAKQFTRASFLRDFDQVINGLLGAS